MRFIPLLFSLFFLGSLLFIMGCAPKSLDGLYAITLERDPEIEGEKYPELKGNRFSDTFRSTRLEIRKDRLIVTALAGTGANERKTIADYRISVKRGYIHVEAPYSGRMDLVWDPPPPIRIGKDLSLYAYGWRFQSVSKAIKRVDD
jgi:hypothetical protein